MAGRGRREEKRKKRGRRREGEEGRELKGREGKVRREVKNRADQEERATYFLFVSQSFIPEFLVENKIIPALPEGAEEDDEDGDDSDTEKKPENAADAEAKKKRKEEKEKLLAAIKKAFADKRAQEKAVREEARRRR